VLILNYISNVIQISNATRLNTRNNHINDVMNNISPSQRATRSNSKMITDINCVNDDCLADPTGLCLRCSKYYCYNHIQLCFQIHPNEIEIIRPMKNRLVM
jgi:hypothetical protein